MRRPHHTLTRRMTDYSRTAASKGCNLLTTEPE